MHSKGRGGGFAFRLFSDSPEGVAGRTAVLYAILAAANVAAWAWALITFRAYPLQLGTAFLAYTFGFRHAVDADHIAAIDNVTLKLMQEGRWPAGGTANPARKSGFGPRHRPCGRPGSSSAPCKLRRDHAGGHEQRPASGLPLTCRLRAGAWPHCRNGRA
jgi:hypothetical protein